ncbi:MAG TPA: hypothetical protein VFJ74_08985, partial [Gemmatimonadaceae bacterium]|nr:hypothetical protein [Gemmatimonadaceae bacterium]
VLAGAWARHADALTAIAPGVRLLLLDPPIAIRWNDDDSASRDGTVSIVRAAGDALPLAAGAARAVALDAATATAARLDAAVRVLAGGGRIVAPAAVTVPAGVRELARDAEVWVAEREAAVARESGPVPLRRTRRS